MKYLGLPLSVTKLKRIHFQALEDKVASKLVPLLGKHVTMARRASLVKSVLTRIVIFYITVLSLPVEVLMNIDSIRRAFIWAACDKVTGGKMQSKFGSGLQACGVWGNRDPQPCEIFFGPSNEMALA
jgi:hypothetical protein